MQGSRIQFDQKPVSNATLEDLDEQRLLDYFRHVRLQEDFADGALGYWKNLLHNSEIMCEYNGHFVPNIAGVLLFGKEPHRFLSQAKITAVAYLGGATTKKYIKGPLVSLFMFSETKPVENYPVLERTFSDKADVLKPGVIEQAVDFVRSSINVRDYPLQAVRESIVNAVTHRDYELQGAIQLSIYSDRIEIVSPGCLLNGITEEKMRLGYRSTRNATIKEVLRDYRYIEPPTGLGIPRKIIKEMSVHNKTKVDLVEGNDRFTVRLRK